MRIAVCYSGLFRDFDKNVDNHISFLLSKYNCDVYCCFWDLNGCGEFTIKYSYNDSDKISESKIDYVVNSLKSKIKIITFESFKDKEFFFQDIATKVRDDGNPPHIKNFTSMFYKIEQVGNLCLKSGIDYDIVLRIRPDIIFTNDVILENVDTNVLVYNIRGSWGGAINDQFIYGKPDTMKIFHNTYNELFYLWDKYGSLNAPEGILNFYFEEKGVITIGKDIPYDLVRNNA